LTKNRLAHGRRERGRGRGRGEGEGRKLKKRSTTRGVKTPRTNLGSSSRSPEGRKLQASQRAKSTPEQEATVSGSQLPPPAARAREKEATRGRGKSGRRSGEASEHVPRRRRADLPERGAGTAALTVSTSRPRDLTPRRPLGSSQRRRRGTEGRCSGSGDEVTCPAHSSGSPPAAQRSQLFAALLLPFQVTSKFALFSLVHR